jgi:PAS domain S-box-containing protein
VSAKSPSPAETDHPSRTGERLALYLPRIMAQWEERVREIVSAAQEQERLWLHDGLPDFLQKLVQALEALYPSTPPEPPAAEMLEEAGSAHGEQRAQMEGYSIDQVLQEYSLLRATLFQVLEVDAQLPAVERDVITGAIEAAMREAALQFAEAQREQLRNRDELHRLLVENARDYAMMTTDCQSRITSWNTGAERLMLWSEAEILGQSAFIIFTPEDREKQAPEKELTIARAEGRAVNERWHLRKDGSRFWGSGIMHPLYDPSGTLVGYGKVMRDRTAEKQVEEERGRYLKRLRMLAEISSDFLFQEQPRQYIEQVYTRLAAHLGLDVYLNYLTAPSGRGLYLASCGGIPPEIAQQIHYLDFGEAISGRVAERRERVVAEYFQESQEPYTVLMRSLGIRAYACHPLIAGEELIGTLSFGTTHSNAFAPDEVELIRTVCEQVAVALERSRLLTALRERAEALTEADRRKDEFLAMLAHELRNPLAGIVNAVHVLEETDSESPARQRLRGIVSRQAGNLTRMVDDLLDVSRITHRKIELRRELLDLAAVVQQAVETVRPLIETRGHTLELNLSDEVLRVEADRTRLEQVISNLLNNAAKYTEPGGHLWLKTERAGSQAVVTILDSGVGISTELLPHVFDLFTQANRTSDRAEGGLGIGLTLVRRLVEMHQGSIEASSDGLGHGSKFTVRLPLVEAGALPLVPVTPELPGARAYRARKVLIVEDNVDAAETLLELLEIWGHEVRLAHSGPDGLDAAREFLPDVILLDIGLPGMNGFEVARRLRSESALGTPCLVAITGYGQDTDREKAREAGFDYHLTKPVDPQRLQALLRTTAKAD